MNKKLYWTLIIVFSPIFVVSAVFVADYAIDSYRYKQQLGNLQVTQPTRPTITLRPNTTGTVTNPTYTEPSLTLPDMPIWPTIPGGPATGRPTDPTNPSGMLADLEALYKLNKDVVGYIYIPDTNVNNPVLQRPSTMNYYLYRDFYGNEDRHGSIYVREACDVFGPSDNVTIYGHNMADGTMFANIHKFKDKTFFDEHPVVYFDTLYERHVYQVVCIFRTSGSYGVGFPYHQYDDFEDEAEFKEFINAIHGKKVPNDAEVDLIHDSGISVSYGDKFICLSTCEEWPITNGRLVLVAVRIS